jgi:oxygen-independent coproporphyrinogen-3 oxidase
MREAGFNRLSLGAQSFHANELRQLGRVHEASDTARAVRTAREAGFENVNLDLMFALPGQTLRDWRENLETAIALRPEHLSLYCLTIEPNTRFHRYAQRGMLDLPGEEAQIRMYDLACEVAADAGYGQYEISNFARPGRECAHNLCYWRGEEYLGYGPGAVGCVAGGRGRLRYTVTKHPERYCQAVESGTGLWCDQEALGPNEMALERLMMGIRLNEGLPEGVVQLDPKGLARSRQSGWVEETGGRLRLTSLGRRFCSEVTANLAT